MNEQINEVGKTHAGDKPRQGTPAEHSDKEVPQFLKRPQEDKRKGEVQTQKTGTIDEEEG